MAILIHYSEIATKGKNRAYFERILVENIRKSIKNNKVYKRHGCIIIDSLDFKLKTLLENIPGIANFSFAEKIPLDFNKMQDTAIEIANKQKFNTFKINARRSNKKFFKTSTQINEEIGQLIKDKLNKEVNLSSPDLEIFIDIGEKEAFLYTNKHKGIGGLPINSNNKIISSLSGGIDSPVASYLMMKRGCKVIFAHIYNKTMGEKSIINKINELVKVLNKTQLNSKLYIIPFEDLQKQIIIHAPAKLRMIIYRRYMMKILNEIAKKENSLALVTGDSIGQVASQTLENFSLIKEASEKPVLSPLIGMNKEEIITLAKKLGTFDISIKPHEDCCSFMIAKHPETKAQRFQIEEYEKKIPDSLISKAVENAQIINF